MDEPGSGTAVDLAMSRVELAASQAAYLSQAMVIMEEAARTLASLGLPPEAPQPGWRSAPAAALDAWTDVNGLLSAALMTASDASRLCRATVDILTVVLNAHGRMRGALRDDAIQAVQDAQGESGPAPTA